MTCLRHFTDHVSDKESGQDPVQKCFRSLDVLAKLVVRSRKLFLRSSVGGSGNNGSADATFGDSVRLIFDSFNRMLSHGSEAFAATQVVFLENVSAVFAHFLELVPAMEVAEFVVLM